MNEPQPPPAPPKKKVSPIVWILLGCVGLIVVIVIVLAGTGAYFVHKVAANPAMAAAKLVVSANPDLDLVSSDDKAGTLTVRNKKTGEVVTVDLDDIKNGHLKFKSGDKESELNVGGEGNEGGLTVTDGSGKTTFKVGGGAGAKVPDWVPMYPGTTPTGYYQADNGEASTGAFALSTKDGAKEVLDYYAKALGEMGKKVDRSTYSANDTEGGILTGGTADGKRQINVTVSSQDGETTVTVTYSEKS
jgi:hypothetical protein